MTRTQITGDQISDGTITSLDIEDGGVLRDDINITSTGHAMIRKVLTSTGLHMTYTGADEGTGDVTIALSTSAGLTSASHRDLDQLVHNLAETAYYEITTVSGKVSVETWWTNVSKTIKIREIDYTYSGNNVTKTVTKQYDALGSLIIGETLTEDIHRTGSNIDYINYTRS